MARSALLNVMVNAVLKAGKPLARDFGEVQNLQVSVKGPGEFVAQASRKAGQMLRQELLRARPDYGWLAAGEDEAEGRDGQHRWVVSPLDGTTNFLHAIPHFCVSVALERAGETVAAVLYNPGNDELWTAEKGGGAYVNDRRLRVANRRDLSDCMIGCAIPQLGSKNHGKFLIELRHVMGEVAGMRGLGSAALDLGFVAAGRLDGAWHEGAQRSDIAGGLLLLREAGGYVSDFNGGDDMAGRREFVAGNERIHKALLAQLAKAALA